MEKILVCVGLEDVLIGLVNCCQFECGLLEEFNCVVCINLLLVIIMIDIDFFDEYNVSYGCMVGDKVLCWVGSVICDINVCLEDLFLCFGIQEIVVLLLGLCLDGVLIVVECICKLIEQLNIEYSVSLSGCVIISIGIVVVVLQCQVDEFDIVLCELEQVLVLVKVVGCDCICIIEDFGKV